MMHHTHSRGMVVSDAVGCTGVERAGEGGKKVGVGMGHPSGMNGERSTPGGMFAGNWHLLHTSLSQQWL